MSVSALARWILRAVLNGRHPARVRARLTVTRRREVEPLKKAVAAPGAQQPAEAPAVGPPPSAERRPRDELELLARRRRARLARRAES
jgi:hypothetical protein